VRVLHPTPDLFRVGASARDHHPRKLSMVTAAQSLRYSPASLTWLRDWIKEELAPYPERMGMVARMVFSATVVMILSMTFRIPYAYLGATFALLVSRESPRTTLWSATKILIGISATAIYILLTMRLVISDPDLHFFWIVGSFFIAFYILSAMPDYVTATSFAVVISAVVPLWDRHVSAQANVEDTLWIAFGSFIGLAVTSAVELIVARRKPGDEVVSPLVRRLTTVKEMLTRLAEHGAVDEVSKKNVIRYALLGTSRVRRLLRRSDYSQHYRAQMNAVLAAVGRLLDSAAKLTEFRGTLTSSDRTRLRNLAGAAETVRVDLIRRHIPKSLHFSVDAGVPSNIPALFEMEEILSLIPQAYADSQTIGEYVPDLGDEPQPKLFSPDTFTSLRHTKFALSGCLAASIAYIIYNAIDWPGISTAVTTCLLTALTTIGSSRQKQVLRFTGAAVGGFVFGMGAQIFILPHVDTILGFTLLFVFVTAVSAWFMTSSPRLSYFGVQVAFAFYLINLQGFAIETSLAVARDRVVGVLLGLFTMWLVFDQLWGMPAAETMKKAFVLDFRLMAQVIREPLSNDPQIAKARRFSLRETVMENFDSVRTAGDAVLFEFGAERREALEWRKRAQIAQAPLRTLFLIRMALWKYRAQTLGFELPAEVLAAQKAFDERSAVVLDGIADRLEGKTSGEERDVQAAFEHLEQTASKVDSQQPPDPRDPQVHALLVLSQRSEQLTTWLTQNIWDRLRD
jgi:multidrug resistance protein MdtO